MVDKKKFIFQFKYWKKKEIGSSLLVFLSYKEEVDMDKPILHLPEKEQGELLTIDGDTDVGEPCMFVKGMYLPVFYCLCFAKNRSTYMSEYQVAEERDTEPNEEKDVRLDVIREENWRDVDEEGNNKKKFHELMWEVYVKYNKELIKR